MQRPCNIPIMLHCCLGEEDPELAIQVMLIGSKLSRAFHNYFDNYSKLLMM